MSVATIDRVKQAIAASVGTDRLTGVKDEDLLVQGGIISSLEMVMIGLELEKLFSVDVPDNALTVSNFKSLAALTRLMEQLTGGTGAAEARPEDEGGVFYRRLQASLTDCFRRPLLFGGLIVAALVLLDAVLMPFLIERGVLAKAYAEFSDNGQRLYRSSGGWAPDDLQVAVARHRIVKDTEYGKPAILFFGDSGTIGSWVRAEDAPPAKVEQRLRATYPNALVHNFGFFMRSFIKDVMLLEALLEKNDGSVPVDAVIFTFSDAYFHSLFQQNLIEELPYFSLNRDLISRFKTRVKTASPASYDRIYEKLAVANHRHRSWITEKFLERTSVYHYKSFLLFMNLFGKSPDAYWQKEYSIGDKPLLPTRLPKPPADFQLHDAGFDKNTIDNDLIALVDDVLDFLTARGIRVYFFLRPYAPLEWKGHSFGTLDMNVDDLITLRGWDKKATIIDLRWSLYGDQFSDSLSHYTPAGSKVLGDAIGDAIAATLPPAAKSTEPAKQ